MFLQNPARQRQIIQDGKGEHTQKVCSFVLYKVLAGAFVICLFLSSFAWATDIDLSIIAKIESNGNPFAYNTKTQATGLYQITPICLKDYNNYHPTTRIAQISLYKPQVARLVAEWYLDTRIPQMLKYYGFPCDIEHILWAYNAGIGNLVKGIKPCETRNYIKKYITLWR